jgi:cytidylate kinase
MKTKSRSIQQIIEDQFKKWSLQAFEEKEKGPLPVVTISREPGSGGEIIAKTLAEKLDFDLFHQEVIHEMAQSANVSRTLFETLDEKGLNTLENWISSLVDDRHLWPDQYLQHLMKVVGAIGKHGRAVIVGRGANFLLPPKGLFRVRVIAPMEERIRHVVEHFKVTREQAKRRIVQTESDRRAFIRKYFHVDIADPQYYDLIVNTGTFTLDKATTTIANVINMQI